MTTNKITLTVLIIIGLAATIFVARFMGLTERPVVTAPRIETQTQARAFAVLAINKDSYKVRDLDANTETTLFIPAGAKIALGNIIVAKQYVVAANGLIVNAFDVLPSAPVGQPPKNLSKNPVN